MEGVWVVSVDAVDVSKAAVAVEVVSAVAVVEVSVPAVSVPVVSVPVVANGDGEPVRSLSPGPTVPTAVCVPSSGAQAAVTNTKANAANKSMREILFILLLLLDHCAGSPCATFVLSPGKKVNLTNHKIVL